MRTARPGAVGPARHDAFEEAGRLLAAGELPDNAGLPCQLVVTVSLTDLERRAGRATTHHGGSLSVEDALRLAAEASMLPEILNDAGGILSYGNTRRLAPPAMRKALFARDRGCTFPGFPRSAARSEIHHATDWALGGRTDIDNLAIACGYHNTEAPKNGLADSDDRRRAALATTTLAPRPTTPTQLPAPPRTTQPATEMSRRLAALLAFAGRYQYDGGARAPRPPTVR
jgi:hypothetical protein